MRFSDVNYNLYKVFIAVYENKSITRAAKELFIGQPNVSRSIKELERHLDVKLFYSNSRGVEATNEGTTLYHRVVPAIAWIQNGEKDIRAFNEKSNGVIRIACTTNFAAYYLAINISKFNKKYPRIQFNIVNIPAEAALERLGNRSVDLVLSTFPLNDKGEFEKIELAQLNEICVASMELAALYNIEKVITREQFEKLPYILIRQQEPIKRPVAIVDSQETAFQLVINNTGVAICAEQFIERNHPNDPIFKFTIKDKEMTKRKMLCLYNEDYTNKATEMFLAELVAPRSQEKIIN